ncbi:hypothetical protein PFZ59_04100 [Streptococcus suis]|uniref:hypothetical protein n=1 Tax=Streptococcus suis TaxID=1307 RepID=UPI00240E3C6B|nr:hypothetical protein [Streptococcus suis]WFA76627.1 hypothetical protein PFZ59_04100 [Streptococcus suis]
MTSKLIANWQKKNYQLSQLVVGSLEGLDVWETVLALGKIRNSAVSKIGGEERWIFLS